MQTTSRAPPSANDSKTNRTALPQLKMEGKATWRRVGGAETWSGTNPPVQGPTSGGQHVTGMEILSEE